MDKLFIGFVLLSPFVISGFYLTNDLVKIFKQRFQKPHTLQNVLTCAYIAMAILITWLTCSNMFNHGDLIRQAQSDAKTIEVIIFIVIMNLYFFVIFAGIFKAILFMAELCRTAITTFIKRNPISK